MGTFSFEQISVFIPPWEIIYFFLPSKQPTSQFEAKEEEAPYALLGTIRLFFIFSFLFCCCD